MTYRFEWDQWKARRNRSKHSVSFEEGSTVFGDQWLIFIEDLEHSESEDRYLAIGMSNANRLLLVSFTMTPEGHDALYYKTHAVRLTGLTPNARYYFKVTSLDRSSNSARSRAAAFEVRSQVYLPLMTRGR